MFGRYQQVGKHLDVHLNEHLNEFLDGNPDENLPKSSYRKHFQQSSFSIKVSNLRPQDWKQKLTKLAGLFECDDNWQPVFVNLKKKI